MQPEKEALSLLSMGLQKIFSELIALSNIISAYFTDFN